MTTEKDKYEKTILYDDDRYFEIIIDRESKRIISMRPLDDKITTKQNESTGDTEYS